MSALLVVTIVSLAVATVMSVLAWRLAREERLRSEARVAALAAEIRSGIHEGIHESEPAPIAVNNLFAGPAVTRVHAGVFSTLAIGVLVVGGMLALVIALTGGSRAHPITSPVADGGTPAVREVAAMPVELIALGHERRGDRLIVRGVVRAPQRANVGDPLNAVVYVFDRAGTFLSSGRAPFADATRADGPGVESSFAVEIAGVTDVHRYRVSFRNADRTVAHVDRRDSRLTAQLP